MLYLLWSREPGEGDTLHEIYVHRQAADNAATQNALPKYGPFFAYTFKMGVPTSNMEVTTYWPATDIEWWVQEWEPSTDPD